MGKSLENIFSEDNLLDYGKACLEVALGLSGRSYDTLVIPSRGAFPIFLGAISAMRYLCRDHEDFGEDLMRLNPYIKVNGWLDRYLPRGKQKQKELPRINILFVPFTADLHIEDVDNTKVTEMVRDYWARVTSSFLLESEERKEDPYFKTFSDVLLNFIEQRENLSKQYASFPKSKKLALIDTVISGRASSTILDCFDDLKIKPYSVLVADGNKRKLRAPFKQKLERRVYNDQVRLIDVNRIVSEDEGAALEGVTALIYPTVMTGSLNLRIREEENREGFFFGAGSWHYPSPKTSPHSNNFGLFVDTIDHAVALNVLGTYCRVENGEDTERNFVESRRKLLKNMEKQEFSKRKEADIKNFNLNPELIVENSYETGSYVLHVPFNKNSDEKVMHEIISNVRRVEYRQ